VSSSSPKTSYVSEFNDEWHSYEIESLVGHRFRRYGRGEPISKYLTRWKGYGPEFDRWYDEDILDEAKDLVDEYRSKHGVPVDDTVPSNLQILPLPRFLR
jgi:hypothetical protein